VAIESDPKAALASYIQELEDTYYPWYDGATNSNYRIWSIAQGTAIVAGLLTAAVAALTNEDAFRSFGWIRILLVTLPLLGAFASSFLVQTRVRDLFTLREQGRQTVQAIASQARAEFAAATSPERYSTIHRDLVAKITLLEKDQNVGFFSVVPDLGASKKVS
jgi:hypothetical protein